MQGSLLLLFRVDPLHGAHMQVLHGETRNNSSCSYDTHDQARPLNDSD